MKNDKKQLCAKCKYAGRWDAARGWNARNLYCNYICIERKRRPCDAKNCTAFKER